MLLSLCHTGGVHAAGLGRLNVLSHLGQPFAAEIDLINVTAGDLATLRVNLAPPAAYQAANLRFDPALNALRLSVERRANGAPYVRATSLRSVTEPYLDLLVELNSQEGKLQRAYAALLDLPEAAPPVAVAAPPVTAAPASKGDVAPPRASRPSPVRPLATPAQAGNNTLAKLDSKAVESAKSEPAKSSSPAKPDHPAPPVVAPVASEAPKVELPKVEQPNLEPPKPESKASDSTPPAPQAPLPVPKNAAVQPPPERGVIDTVKQYLVPIGAVGLALLAGIAGLWALGSSRRRKPVAGEASELMASRVEPETSTTVGSDAKLDTAAASGDPAVSAVARAADHEAAAPEATVANVTDRVDPIDEAKVYLDYGQSEPAETILREALNQEPGREDIQMLLLEILSGRGDKDGFNKLARRLHRQTGGLGAHWKHAMAMGYALDPTYPLYLPADGAVPPRTRSAVQPPGDMGNTTDMLLQSDDSHPEMAKTMVLANAGVMRTEAAAQALPDINFELPPASAPGAADTDVAPDKAAAAPAASAAAGLDIEIDFSSVKPKPLDVPLEWDKPAAMAADTTDTDTAAADAHWEAVQQKIELARAYREMGDKEGALELLREAEREGDAGQQTEVREMQQMLQ